MDENYFGGVRKSKRGRGTLDRVAVFGLLKHSGKQLQKHSILLMYRNFVIIESIIQRFLRTKRITLTVLRILGIRPNATCACLTKLFAFSEGV